MPPFPPNNLPDAAAPVGSIAAPAIPAPAIPPPPADTADTARTTSFINAGNATNATPINVKPVMMLINPVPSSRNTLVPANLNAVAYTIAAAGL